MTGQPTLTVYSRQGCHLCEVMIEQLLPLTRDLATVDVRDVDSRDDWREQFGLRVPVLACGDQTICEFELDRDAVRQVLNGRRG